MLHLWADTIDFIRSDLMIKAVLVTTEVIRYDRVVAI